MEMYESPVDLSKKALSPIDLFLSGKQNKSNYRHSHLRATATGLRMCSCVYLCVCPFCKTNKNAVNQATQTYFVPPDSVFKFSILSMFFFCNRRSDFFYRCLQVVLYIRINTV